MSVKMDGPDKCTQVDETGVERWMMKDTGRHAGKWDVEM